MNIWETQQGQNFLDGMYSFVGEMSKNLAGIEASLEEANRLKYEELALKERELAIKELELRAKGITIPKDDNRREDR